MTGAPELKPCPNPDCGGAVSVSFWPDPKYPQNPKLQGYSCSCGWRAPFSDSEERAREIWNKRLDATLSMAEAGTRDDAYGWNYNIEKAPKNTEILVGVNADIFMGFRGNDLWCLDGIHMVADFEPDCWMSLPKLRKHQPKPISRNL